jgi:pimeloyl-ACP methyl ester carboxylesterase
MGVAAEGKVVVGGVKTKDGLAYLTLGTTKSLTTDIFNNWGPGEGGLSDDYPTHLLYSPEDYFTNLIYSIETNSTELPIDKKTIQPLGGRIPIILVHGWQGDDGKTKPQSQMTKKLSADDYWYNLIQFFQNNPTLKSKYKLYVYKYPSYKHVTFNALKLKTLLDAMPDLKNAQQMSFIGHSMGTIVIRSLFEEHDFDHNRAQKIILLDGVHHGSPAAVPGLVYLNTDIPFGWGKDLYTLGSNDIQWDNYDNIYNATSLYNDKPINKLIFNIMFDYSNASNYTAYLPNTPNQYIAPTLSSRIGLLFSPEKNIASSPNSLENQLITKADEQDVNFYCFPNPSIQKQCIRRSENSAFDTIYRKRIIDLMINNPQISLPSIKNSSDVNSYKSSTISYLP